MPVPTSLPTNVASTYADPSDTAAESQHKTHHDIIHDVINTVTLPTTTKTASYTFVLSDYETMVEYSSASAGTFTVPLNSSVAFPVGTVIRVSQMGTGALTVAGASGVTVVGTLTTSAQYVELVLRQRAANSWVVVPIGSASAGSGISSLTYANAMAGSVFRVAYSSTWTRPTSRTDIYFTLVGGTASDPDPAAMLNFDDRLLTP
jgi:hypothetical protein